MMMSIRRQVTKSIQQTILSTQQKRRATITTTATAISATSTDHLAINHDNMMNNIFHFQRMTVSSSSSSSSPTTRKNNQRNGGGYNRKSGNDRGHFQNSGKGGHSNHGGGNGSGGGNVRGGSGSGSGPRKHRYPKTNLRAHAVSVMDGDYTDYDLVDSDFNIDDDEGYKTNSTLYNKFANLENEEEFNHEGNMDDTEKWSLINYNKVHEDYIDDDEREQRQREKDAYEQQKQEDAKRARWIENAKPPTRTQQIDASGKSYGRGGRKTSTARVWIYPGEGVVTINRREFLDYFPRESDREMILSPFVATRTCGMFDMTVQVSGGGVTGKAGAIRHGLARALEKYNPDYRPPMKRLGYMTRDPRKVERKKIGLKKARKAPQWVRR